MDARSHAAAVALPSVADHVTPWSTGGANDESNLVTACGVCNYAKGNATLAALGLADPLERPPAPAAWNGEVEVPRVT